MLHHDCAGPGTVPLCRLWLPRRCRENCTNAHSGPAEKENSEKASYMVGENIRFSPFLPQQNPQIYCPKNPISSKKWKHPFNPPKSGHITMIPKPESGWWFQPTWLKNMIVKMGIFPKGSVWKYKNIWNHHLDNCGSVETGCISRRGF